MLVRCSNCQTQFSLDEGQVGPEGAAIRCSVCGYVFRVDADDPMPWQLRTVDGDLFSAADLATVRTWIGEGRLHPNDRVSRTGKHWIRLGEMPEFSDAFAGFPDLPEVLEPVHIPLAPSIDELGPPPDFDQQADGPESFVDFVPNPDGVTTSVDVLQGLDLPRLTGRASVGDEPGSGTISKALAEVTRVVRPSPPKAPTDKVKTIQGEPVEPKPSERLRVLPEESSPLLEAPDVAPSPAGPADPDSDPSIAKVPVQPAVERRPVPLSNDLGSDLDADLAEFQVPRQRLWPLAAVAGVVAGVGIMFGVPTVRRQVFVMAGVVAGDEERVAALASAEQAVASGVGLDEALGHIEGRVEAGDLDPRREAQLALARVEVLATRALEAQISAAADPSAAQSFLNLAADDVERAQQAFAGIDVSQLAEADVKRARARLRLVQLERALSEAEASLPSDRPEQLALLIRAAPLWRDAQAPVPEGLIEGLQGLGNRSTMASLVLALAYLRGDDRVGARAILDPLVAEHPRLEAAAALKAALEHDKPPADPTDAEPPDDANAELDKPPTDSDSDPADPAQPKPKAKPNPPDAEPKPKRVSVDTLMDRGCTLVEKRQYKAGVELLLDALDRRPNDVDVLTCLGEAQLGMGNTRAAERYLDKAVERAPRMAPALRGAARTAKRLGKTEKALVLYRRLKGVRPSDNEARDFIDAHSKPKPTSPDSPSPTPKPEASDG